jgi:hypothetical protein
VSGQSNFVFGHQLILCRTYVQWGLACMADDSNKMSVDAAPMSLWMRSDRDSSGEDNEGNEKDGGQDESERQQEAVRICRQGQALNPKKVGRFDRNLPMPSTLSFPASLADLRLIFQYSARRLGWLTKM